ncbi:MAG: hypothetical protein IKK92_03140 [Prevotella sp.]|nr:hypothetical protein [Prevotella sp.]
MSKITSTAVSSRVTQSLFINVLRCPVRPSVRPFRLLRCHRNHQRKGCTTCCLFVAEAGIEPALIRGILIRCRLAPFIPAFPLP